MHALGYMDLHFGEPVKDKDGLCVGCDILQGNGKIGRIHNKKGKGYKITLHHTRVKPCARIYLTDMEYRYYDTLGQAKADVMSYFDRRYDFMQEAGWQGNV